MGMESHHSIGRGREERRGRPSGWKRLLAFLLLLLMASPAFGQAESPAAPGGSGSSLTTPAGPADPLRAMQLPNLSSRENFSAAMQIIILLTVLSLAPAILIMMTSFTRIIIVLSLLRQAMGDRKSVV